MATIVDCGAKASGSNYVLTSGELDGKNAGPVTFDWAPTGKSKAKMTTTNDKGEVFVSETNAISATVAAKLEKAKAEIDGNRMKVTLKTKQGQTLTDADKEELKNM